ncbi:hypothetical protein B0T09DRAFT_9456 [Sordaria sp. MPI-SDFR-AT-0083]|nr:hypothetical protein B0T09DRAFT_9456 [Sordaria sp. MPI-SDFR-AT-0083]
MPYQATDSHNHALCFLPCHWSWGQYGAHPRITTPYLDYRRGQSAFEKGLRLESRTVPGGMDVTSRCAGTGQWLWWPPLLRGSNHPDTRQFFIPKTQRESARNLPAVHQIATVTSVVDSRSDRKITVESSTVLLLASRTNPVHTAPWVVFPAALNLQALRDQARGFPSRILSASHLTDNTSMTRTSRSSLMPKTPSSRYQPVKRSH